MFRTVSDAPVYAVSEGHARHIVDQPLFFNIGYRDDLVLWVGDGTEDEVTLGIESEIDFDTIHQCENGRKERSTSDCVSCSEATEPGHGGECHDLDSDGYDDQVCGGTDCDDTRASVHPNAPEICDERDNNCMNGVDEQTDFDWDDQNCGECGEVCGGEYHLSMGTVRSMVARKPSSATMASCAPTTHANGTTPAETILWTQTAQTVSTATSPSTVWIPRFASMTRTVMMGSSPVPTTPAKTASATTLRMTTTVTGVTTAIR